MVEKKGSLKKKIIKYALLAGVVLVILFVSVLAGAEYYTGKSSFCGSCHIMTPYLKSWEKDVHAKKNVAQCIDCHYAPGERHTINAKLRGLSQLMSYFSGRSGSARPRPRVQDESCLREGCHLESKFIDVTYPIKDIKFVHSKHLKMDEKTLAANADNLTKLAGKLNAVLDNATFEAVYQTAIEVGHQEANQQKIKKIVQTATANPQIAEIAIQYALAVHRDIRLKQVGNLRCTTCHAHNDDENHFSVKKQVCFLCHFANQTFNSETSRCLSCHTPPAIKIQVHEKITKVTAGIAKSMSGSMDHAVIIENNVNCVSCHADLVVGTGKVSRERCSACHDLSKYYEKFDKNLNTETVNSLHTVHTSKLHANCTECHEQFEHQLNKDQMTVKGEFLSPVLDNCAHCHPNHHHRQVEMFAGRAPGKLIHGASNAMFGSRVNCLSCHTKAAEDQKGLPVFEATKQACIVCHSHDYDKLFDEWISRLNATVTEAKTLEAEADNLLKKYHSPQAKEFFIAGHEALQFVEKSKGIHNRNYALELLDYAVDQFTKTIELVTPTKENVKKVSDEKTK